MREVAQTVSGPCARLATHEQQEGGSVRGMLHRPLTGFRIAGQWEPFGPAFRGNFASAIPRCVRQRKGLRALGLTLHAVGTSYHLFVCHSKISSHHPYPTNSFSSSFLVEHTSRARPIILPLSW